jgi:hypothetical protein
VVPHVGLSGASDPAVWRYAYENDLIVVTTNAKDTQNTINAHHDVGVECGETLFVFGHEWSKMNV